MAWSLQACWVAGLYGMMDSSVRVHRVYRMHPTPPRSGLAAYGSDESSGAESEAEAEEEEEEAEEEGRDLVVARGRNASDSDEDDRYVCTVLCMSPRCCCCCPPPHPCACMLDAHNTTLMFRFSCCCYSVHP